MAIEDVLKESLEHLRSGQLTNEAQIKSAVIVPILRALGWNDDKPAECLPEYPVRFPGGGHGFVDYALFGDEPSGRRPIIFIETKNVGNVTEAGVEQVFRYAVNRGVPFLILTDGNIWEFYLSMAAGFPAERLFRRIELEREDSISDHARFLDQFLRKHHARMPQTKLDAEHQLTRYKQRTVARNKIPLVWRSLLEPPDESLCELITNAVVEECSFSPDIDDVRRFLAEDVLPHSPAANRSDPIPNQELPKPKESPPPKAVTKYKQKPIPKVIGFVLDDRRTEAGSAIRTLVEIVREFQRLDSSFMGRFASQTIGTKNRLVARTKNDLFKSPRLRKNSKDLHNGWWIRTNLSSVKVREHILTACEVMGIDLGSRLTLIER